MKKFLIAVVTCGMAFGLTACGTTTKATDTGQSPALTGSNRPAETTAVEPPVVEPEADAIEPSPTEEPPPASDEPLKFGKTFTYTDGLTVTIGKPVKFTPSDTAMFTKSKAYVKFTVTVVNGTGKTFDPSMFNASAQSANLEADEVFDSAKGLDGSPDTKLLKGREAKFVIGFGVSEPKDIVLEITPSFEHDSALFVN